MIEIVIKIDGNELDSGAVADWAGVPKLLHKIKELLQESIHNEEKIMADLTAEFAALGEQLTRQATEIDREIQQVLDAVNAGNVAAQVVEDARTRISAITDQIRASADTLAADNPPTP
jgi:predicted nuclease with TOPRIM domain